MNTSEVFNAFFRELEERGVPAVILHSYAGFPDQILSDVDYAVPHEALARLPQIEQAVAQRCGWVVAQRLRHETTACSAILVNPERPGESVMLDVASHYSRNGCVFLRDADLLHQRRRYKEFFIPDPATEFIYTWTKILAKGKAAEPYLPRLRELYQAGPERSEELFARLFGSELGSAREWLTRPVAEWSRLEQASHQRSRFTLRQRWQNFRRVWRRICQPTGMTLVFLGPDGAGKSTVISSVTALLRPCFRREMRIHFNPRFTPDPGATPNSTPHAQPPRGALMSWGKVLFYFLRHWAHWFLRQWPARVSSTLIIYDRTFVDLLVDPRRYRVQRAAWLIGLLSRLLPRPDLTFILDAPVAVIHRRKAELTEAEIERQRGVLRELAEKSARTTVLSTEMPPDEVGKAAVRKALTLLEARNRVPS